MFLQNYVLTKDPCEAQKMISELIKDLSEKECETIRDIVSGAPLAKKCMDDKYYNVGTRFRPTMIDTMASAKLAQNWATQYRTFSREKNDRMKTLKNFLPDFKDKSESQIASVANQICSRMGKSCVGCKELRWNSEMFSWKYYRNAVDQNGCGYGCWRCFGSQVEERFEKLKNDDWKGCVECLNPNCKAKEFGCYCCHMGQYTWLESYLKEKYGPQVVDQWKKKLDPEKWAYFEPTLRKGIETMKTIEHDTAKNCPQSDMERSIRNLYNNTNYKFVKNDDRKPFSDLWRDWRTACDASRLRANLKAVKTHKQECEAHIQKGEWEDMYKSMNQMQSMVKNCHTYSSYVRNKEPKNVHEINFHEMTRDYLASFDYYYHRCQSFAHQCSVCFETLPVAESEMIFTHEGTESLKTKTRCMTCKSCLEKYVSMTSAIKKPKFTCPGVGCGMALNIGHIQKVCPKAHELYEYASFKYKLKVARDFKVCPNNACGKGFSVYEGCDVRRLSCPTCTHEFCPDCYGPPHEDIGDGSCRDYLNHQHRLKWICLRADMNIDSKESEEAIKKMEAEERVFIEQNTKQCPYCMVWIEKNGGCNHMTCHHCSGEFCWKCQKRYRGHRTCQDSFNVHRPYLYELFPTQVFEEENDEDDTENDEKYDSDDSDSEKEENEEKMDEDQSNYRMFMSGFEDHAAMAYRSFLSGFDTGKDPSLEIWKGAEVDLRHLDARDYDSDEEESS